MIISLAIIAAGVATVIYAEHRSSTRPSTDDASIDANVVRVASVVGGKIIEIAVAENAKVAKGDVLFRIDPEPYRLVVEQTEADLGIAIAALDTRRRALATEKSNAKIASEQTKRAQTNYELAARTAERLRPLASKAYVPTQQFDQAQTTKRDAATSLQQAQEQEVAAPSGHRHGGRRDRQRQGATGGTRDRDASARGHDGAGAARRAHGGIVDFIGRNGHTSAGAVHADQHGSLVRGRQLSGDRVEGHRGRGLRDRLFHD